MGGVIEKSAPTWRPSRRVVLLGVAALAGLLLLAVLAHVTGATDAFAGVTEEAGDWAYLAVFLSVFGDAIIPIFPSETVLSTASALAADGSLGLGYVIVAGSLGAVLGDSALYWIARLSGHRLQPQIDKAKKHEKVAAALDFMGSSAPLLIVAGRYVPGLRFAVNATMGIAEYPYRRFLLWSTIGGVAWAAYTCCLAYVVSTTLEGFPLASVIISGTITTIALGIIFVVVRRNRRREAALAA
jgi:membrane-associated protein